MRVFGLAERIISPRRVASTSSAAIDAEEDPEREIFKNLWKQRWLLPPADSRFSRRRLFHKMLLYFTAYEQIYIPLQLAFQVPRVEGIAFQLPATQLIIQYFIDLCFLVEIALQFRTTYLGRAELGSLVQSDVKDIALRYTRYPYVWRGNFMWDLLAALPIDLLAAAMTGGILGINGQWMRVNRLLHGWRVIAVHGSHISQSNRPRKIAIYGLLWFFMAHFFACCWWAIGLSDFNVAAAVDANKLPWNLRVSQGAQAVTWSSSFADQYFTCFYWSVTVLVKVPWIAPETYYEQLFTSVVIVVGTFTFSVFIGQVTMQQKSLDMARQARSERLSKLRLFCTSRGVAAATQKDIYQWVLCDQDFSAKYVGRGRLTMLPPAMRGPLLQGMFDVLLESFPFKKNGMSNPGINAMLIKLNPLVLMRGMGLIEPNTISTTLYVLHKGCLRIALPMKKSEAGMAGGDGKKRMRSARVSTSPIRGVKGGGLGLKSTKEFARFRVLERPGSTVGMSNMENLAMPYPFHVDCTMTSNLFSISADALRQAMDGMSSEDTAVCKSTVGKEFKAHVDGLKFDGWEQHEKKLADVGERREVMTEARSSLDSLEDRCATCLKTMKNTKTQTREIVILLQNLGADVSFNSPRKPDGKNGKGGRMDRRGTVMAKMHNQLNDQHQKSDHGEIDGELEERTGYSTVVNNRANAAASRAIS